MDLSDSMATTGCCHSKEAGFLVKSTCAARGAQCCRQMKPPVAPYLHQMESRLTKKKRGKKKKRKRKTFGWPSISAVFPDGVANRAAGCAQECVHAAITCRQGSVLPLCHLWPRALPAWEIRIAFKFSGKSLWYLQPLKLALQNLSRSTCFSLLHFGAFQ